ncbi:MAG: hypothetical protein HPY55_03760 [Firmicutes bacterium]|nr:hypothetical protein [Bacillota bacterium]
MVDTQDGGLLGAFLEGDDSSVYMAQHINQMVAGKRYIQIHTHTSRSSLSYQDATLLYYHGGPERNIQSVYVVGCDETRYLLSRQTGKKIAEAWRIKVVWIAERDRLTPKWIAKVRSGETTEEQAWKEHSHEIWVNIANRLGLMYDRLE